jgi:GAF domain-containing protein
MWPRASRPGPFAWPVYAAAMAGIHDRYERLLDAGLALAADLALPVVLQRIVELAAELAGAGYGALGVLGRDGAIAEFITTGVGDAERAAIGHIPVGRGILGVVIHDPRPLRLRDIADDPRSVGFPPNHPPMRSFLGVPVMARGRVYGNLYLSEKAGGGEFDADDERTLTLLAAQAGAAIGNAQLYEETQDRARRLEAVRAVTTAILAGTEPGELLALVVRQARELLDADLATVALPAGGDRLAVEAADGLGAERLLGGEFPVEVHPGWHGRALLHRGAPAGRPGRASSTRLPAGWLSAIAGVAQERGDGLLVEVGVGQMEARLRRRVSIRLGEPVRFPSRSHPRPGASAPGRRGHPQGLPRPGRSGHRLEPDRRH